MPPTPPEDDREQLLNHELVAKNLKINRRSKEERLSPGTPLDTHQLDYHHKLSDRYADSLRGIGVEEEYIGGVRSCRTQSSSEDQQEPTNTAPPATNGDDHQHTNGVNNGTDGANDESNEAPATTNGTHNHDAVPAEEAIRTDEGNLQDQRSPSRSPRR